MIISAITKTTFLENIRQPVYLLLTIIGVALIFLSQYVTLFSLGNTTVTIVETAFTSLLVIGLSIAIFSSSTLIYYEFESKTLMTVLSKPVKHYQIIVGKFFGILLAILLSSSILIAVIVMTAWMSSKANADVIMDATFLGNIAKISLLIISQLIIITSVTISLSTFLPITLTAVFTLLFFFLGHLQDTFSHYAKSNAIAASFAKVYEIFVPNLEFQNLSQRLYINSAIETDFVVTIFAYSILYVIVFLVVATMLIERKDFS